MTYRFRHRLKKSLSLAGERILFRLRPKAFFRSELLGCGIDWDAVGGAAEPETRLDGYLGGRKWDRVAHLVSEADLAWYAQHDPFADHGDTVARAEQILDHRIEVAGLGVVDCGRRIDWARDPVSGARYPSGLFSVYPNPATDGRFRTELNLHRHFPILAKAALITGDSRYAEELCRQWRGWRRQSPPVDDTFLSDGLELASRACAWTHCLRLLRSANVPEDFLLDMLDTTWRYGRLLDKNFNAASSGNNHQVAEAFGLFFLGLMYPELRPSDRMRARGMEQLHLQALNQFHEDGVHKEQSSNYHMFVLECFLTAMLLCERNAVEFPEPARERVERAADYLLHLAKPDGSVPMLGNAGFKFFCPTGDPSFHPRTLLAVAARVFQRADLATAAGEASEEVFWFLGRDGLEVLRDLRERGAMRRGGLGFFPQGGHTVARFGEGPEASYLHFDCGHQGLPPRAGHGHDDALSFVFSARGQDFVVDPGTFTYMRSDPLRKHLRGARGHSCVVIDGQGPADPGVGMFGWDRTAEASLLDAAADDEVSWFRGCHEAYPGIRVERAVLFREGRYLVILDHVRGNGKHTVETLLPLAPDLRVESGDQTFRCRGTSSDLLVGAVASRVLSATMHRGAEETQPSWYAPAYGRVCETSTLRWFADAELPFRQATVLLPIAANLSSSLAIELGEDTDAGAGDNVLAIRCPELEVDDLLVQGAGGQAWVLGGVETDAPWALIHASPSGPRAHTRGATFVRGAVSHSALRELKP
ncbi:MAG: alginate lyase family protein [Deferrisomatales bacterium]